MKVLGPYQSLSRDLKLLFLSLFLWTFGYGLYNYVWPIYLRNLQANSEQIGLVFSAGFFAAALSMIPGGLLANRYELRKLLVVSWAASLPSPVIFYLAGTWTDVIPGLLILQLSGFGLPGLFAYIAATVDRREVSSSFGTVFSAAPLGIVFSPALGSVLLGWFQVRDLFLLTLLFFTVSTLILFPIKRQPPRRQDPSPKLELPKTRTEIVILVFLAGVAVAYSVSLPFLPLYSQDILGLNESQVQLLGATLSFGVAVFTVALGRLATSWGKGRSMAVGLSISAIGILAIAVVGSRILVFPFAFLFGAERAPGIIAYSILSMVKGGASRAGRFGFYLTLEQLGLMAGSYIGGPMYHLQPNFVLYTTGMSFLGLAALSLLGLGHLPTEGTASGRES